MFDSCSRSKSTSWSWIARAYCCANSAPVVITRPPAGLACDHAVARPRARCVLPLAGGPLSTIGLYSACRVKHGLGGDAGQSVLGTRHETIQRREARRAIRWGHRPRKQDGGDAVHHAYGPSRRHEAPSERGSAKIKPEVYQISRGSATHPGQIPARFCGSQIVANTEDAADGFVHFGSRGCRSPS